MKPVYKMRWIFFVSIIITLVAFVWGYKSAKTIRPDKDNQASLFTKADAEKIMGEEAHLKDSSNSKGKSVSIFQLAYSANEKDKKGIQGVVYFMYEKYAFDSSAHRVYYGIKKSNEKNGIKTLDNMGDEAYFHTDNTNFYFIMARKGNQMFRIKVNKITSNTSLDEFNRISKRIVEML